MSSSSEPAKLQRILNKNKVRDLQAWCNFFQLSPATTNSRKGPVKANFINALSAHLGTVPEQQWTCFELVPELQPVQLSRQEMGDAAGVNDPEGIFLCLAADAEDTKRCAKALPCATKGHSLLHKLAQKKLEKDVGSSSTLPPLQTWKKGASLTMTVAGQEKVGVVSQILWWERRGLGGQLTWTNCARSTNGRTTVRTTTGAAPCSSQRWGRQEQARLKCRCRGCAETSSGALAHGAPPASTNTRRPAPAGHRCHLLASQSSPQHLLGAAPAKGKRYIAAGHGGRQQQHSAAGCPRQTSSRRRS